MQCCWPLLFNAIQLYGWPPLASISALLLLLPFWTSLIFFFFATTLGVVWWINGDFLLPVWRFFFYFLFSFSSFFFFFSFFLRCSILFFGVLFFPVIFCIDSILFFPFCGWKLAGILLDHDLDKRRLRGYVVIVKRFTYIASWRWRLIDRPGPLRSSRLSLHSGFFNSVSPLWPIPVSGPNLDFGRPSGLEQISPLRFFWLNDAPLPVMLRCESHYKH